MLAVGEVADGRDPVAGPGPAPEPVNVHDGLLASAHVQLHQSAEHGDGAGSGSAEGGAADAWWKLLYAHHADLVLNGHEHLYARFAPMDPAGNADGTDQYYGTMKFTLAPGGYRCNFASALESSTAPAGTAPSYSDTGSQRCHGDGREY